MQPLTATEKLFAEKNHKLLITFMSERRLGDDEYGALAGRYLHTVVRYLNEPKLQSYAFSTVLFRNLQSELSSLHAKAAPELLPFDIDIPDPASLYDDPPMGNSLWGDIEPLLTASQAEMVLLRDQGYTNREIAQMQGLTERTIEKQFSRIRSIVQKHLDRQNTVSVPTSLLPPS